MENKTLRETINGYREQLQLGNISNSELGSRFEILIKRYLISTRQYHFEAVWLWEEFPYRTSFSSGIDVGIDLVAKEKTGDYWAVQCKCYDDTKTIRKNDLDSFVATSGGHFYVNDIYRTTFKHRLFFTTASSISNNARDLARLSSPHVAFITIHDLDKTDVDWQHIERGVSGKGALSKKKKPKPHQEEAVLKAREHYKNYQRGKLIMACGTGKTFTSLRIIEDQLPKNSNVLYLVPSIALMSQTITAWNNDSTRELDRLCVCSDRSASKSEVNKNEKDFSIIELAYPATTDVDELTVQYNKVKNQADSDIIVFFSTYQSIDVIIEFCKQKELTFDFIICDEAHRTASFRRRGIKEKYFAKVHDDNLVPAKKRLYMTATPKIYTSTSKERARESDTVLYSMDSQEYFGKEFYKLSFGDAIEKNELSDYEVIVFISKTDQYKELIDRERNADAQGIRVTYKSVTFIDGIRKEKSEFLKVNVDKATKLYSCIDIFSKSNIRLENDDILKDDPSPMKTVVLFDNSIQESKKTVGAMQTFFGEKEINKIRFSATHVDGTMSSLNRKNKLSWLENGFDEFGKQKYNCRGLSNVKVLSEGVDVPALDAIVFLADKSSEIDIVQSVGRVMRKAPGKKRGYIIIPIVIEDGLNIEDTIRGSKFATLFKVLNALKSHDERLSIEIDRLQLNPPKGPTGPPKPGRPTKPTFVSPERDGSDIIIDEVGKQISIYDYDFKDLFTAVLVDCVANKKAWEDWAKDVGEILKSKVNYINRSIRKHEERKQLISQFTKELKKSINDEITQKDAVDMLAQQFVTKPVFEALFENYSFTSNNTISENLEKLISHFKDDSREGVEELESLQPFYESVKRRVRDITTLDGKQSLIKELYDTFFAHALPGLREKLGIVYTPIEVIDFIIHSVGDLLKQEFNLNISDEGVSILDPFTGTGTFITRLLQSGIIDAKDLERKYRHEIYASEIVLLAYYIADVNIESTFRELNADRDYVPFNNIVLRDTFRNVEKIDSVLFKGNTARIYNQSKQKIQIIIGNPPYSVGQKSQNDNNENPTHLNINERIKTTYVQRASYVHNKSSLYDSYFKAFRWASDRVSVDTGGIIGFVTNGAWLDTTAGQGFRRTIEKEFSAIYVFNLRGNQRTSGIVSKKEGGKIFGAGSRTPICITFLIKKPKATTKATIRYHDIGDYLTRDEKLEKIKRFKSILNEDMKLKTLKPDEHGDWINQRKAFPEDFIPLCGEKKFDPDSKSFFIAGSSGVISGRDAFVNNYSKERLKRNVNLTIEHYKSELERTKFLNNKSPIINKVKGIWSSDWKKKLAKGREIERFNKDQIYKCSYRPFNIVYRYFNKDLNWSRYQTHRFFLDNKFLNPIISLTGKGSTNKFAVLMTNKLYDYSNLTSGQGFPLHYYLEPIDIKSTQLELELATDKQSNITNHVLKKAQKLYGANVKKEDIFYYVYGFLHSPEYIESFEHTLKKELPKIPLLPNKDDFWNFRKAGKELARLHINYEDVPTHPQVQVSISRSLTQIDGAKDSIFRVVKMKHPKKNKLDTIIFNESITITNIPIKAYEYVVNGKSAIGWVMERYQITIDKSSGIVNDPNDWAQENGNPRYILDLLLSIINLSVETIAIINRLPKIKF